MLGHKLIATVCFFLCNIAFAVDVSEDTFGRLLNKQAQVMDSELDAKIRSNQAQAGTAGTPSPLVGYNQSGIHGNNEPTVYAIWGMEGSEVAEMSYRGKNIPVSMKQPYINKLDRWKLESINAYQVTLVQLSKYGKVINRKVIMFDWSQGTNNTSSNLTNGVITPEIKQIRNGQ